MYIDIKLRLNFPVLAIWQANILPTSKPDLVEKQLFSQLSIMEQEQEENEEASSRSHLASSGSKKCDKKVNREASVESLKRQIATLTEELNIEKERTKCWEDEKLALENLITVQAEELTEKQEQFKEKLAEKNAKYKQYKRECFRINEELKTFTGKEETYNNLIKRDVKDV